MKSKGMKIWFASIVVLLAVGVVPAVRAAEGTDPNKSPALCGSADTPETGIQGDVRPERGVNCGLTFLAQVQGGGSVQGSGRCGYVRTLGVIKVFDLSDPENPVQTADLDLSNQGGSESMRAQTTPGRAILVSGKRVWDIRDCEQPVFKGEIPWPSILARPEINQRVASTNQHEIAISHDAMKVYGGLGFAIAYLDDLDKPEEWKVYNHSCEVNRQAGYPLYPGPAGSPTVCDVAPEGEWPAQLSHSSDDNLEGTRWYGASQKGGNTEIEPASLRGVDITERGKPTLIGELHEFPGHSMNWWRNEAGQEFVVGANEGGPGDTCQPHPRATSLGNAADGYVAEVTGDQLSHASRVSLMINEPQNCEAEEESGSNAGITEHSIYNQHGAALLMVEYGSAGLRVFDVRDGYAPKEVAYFNTSGHVHSGLFHYDAARGIMLQSASNGMRVLELQPQVIAAAGLPTPTDPAYPRFPNGGPAVPDGTEPPPPPPPQAPCPVPQVDGVNPLIRILVCGRLP